MAAAGVSPGGPPPPPGAYQLSPPMGVAASSGLGPFYGSQSGQLPQMHSLHPGSVIGPLSPAPSSVPGALIRVGCNFVNCNFE